MKTKNPSIFRKLRGCESFYAEKEKKKCHYAACEKVNFYVIFIKVNSPYTVAREYHGMQLKEICKGTYQEEIGMFLSLMWKEEDMWERKEREKNHFASFVTFLLGRQKFLTNIYEYQFITIILSKLGNAWEVFAHRYLKMPPNSKYARLIWQENEIYLI